MSREPRSWIHDSGRRVDVRSRQATKNQRPYFAVFLDNTAVGRVFNLEDDRAADWDGLNLFGRWDYTPRLFRASMAPCANRTAAANALVDYVLRP